MAAPVAYSWADVGAPTLNANAGTFISVLDFCMLSNGWSKVYSGTNKAAYRADAGERKFYRVLDDASMVYNSVSYKALVTGYDSMSDIDTGTGWTGQMHFNKSLATASGRKWYAWVDPKGVLIATSGNLTTDTTDTYPYSFQYFGETVPVLHGGTPRNVILGGSVTVQYSVGDMFTAALLNAETVIKVNRNHTGSALNQITNRAETQVQQGPYVAGAETNTLSYPYNGGMILESALLWDTTTNKIVIDKIPWVKHIMQKGSTLTESSYTDGTNTYKAFPIAHYYSNFHSTLPTAASGNRGIGIVCTTESR